MGEGGGSISEAHTQNTELEASHRGSEGCLGHVTGVEGDLVIAAQQVQATEDLGTLQLIQ